MLIAIGAGLVALPAIPFAGWPAPPSWPWLIASIVIHLFYFAGLIESYRAGDSVRSIRSRAARRR